MPPGRVVVSGHFKRGRDGAEPIPYLAGAFEFVHPRALRKIAGDHDGIETRRGRHLKCGSHMFGHEGMAAVDVRNVQHAHGRDARCLAGRAVSQGARSRRR